MQKRGQSVSLFIILALLVIIGASLTYYLLSGNQGGTERLGIVTDQVLSQQTDVVKNTVQDCLEEKTLEAKELFGLRDDSKPLIEEQLESYLPDCLHTNLKGTGITIVEEKIQATVQITTEPTAESLLVDITYPIKVIRGKNSQSLTKFNYYMPLESGAALSLDQWGRTTTEYRILSHDGRVELIIPKNTKVSDSTGTPVTEISIRTADRNEGGLVNSVVIGMTVYDGQPEGVRFEPAITIQMKYNPDELMGFPEKELKIGWYDAGRGFWWGLPSSRVDTANKIVSAELSHFTKLGVVGCTTPEEGAIAFSFKNVVTRAVKEDASSLASPKECQNSDGNAPQGLDAGSTTSSGTKICAAQQGTDGEYFAFFQCLNGNWLKSLCGDSGCDSATDTCKVDLGNVGTDSPPGWLLSATATEPSPESASVDGCSCSCDKTCQILDGEKLAGLGIEGSLGYATFTIPPDGRACVMAKADGEADMSIEVAGSSGDKFGTPIFLSGVSPSQLNSLLLGDSAGELQAGNNTAYIKLENLNGDDCVWAETNFTIKARGITYPEQCSTTAGTPSPPSGESTDICTVQDAINTLCGNGDPAYDDVYPGIPNCEKDSKGNPIGFLDPARAPTLNNMINEARSINPLSWRPLPLSQLPSRGAVLAKIQELKLTLICGSTNYVCTACAPGAEGCGSSGTGSSFSDSEKASTSHSCTAWEKSLTKDQIKALIMTKTEEVVLSRGMGDADYFAKLMVGIATTENGLKHCDGDAVLVGDGGVSIGMMAVNSGEQHCAGSNIYRIECNIESAVNVLINKYNAWGCDTGHTLDCTETCQSMGQKADCSNEAILWKGWDCAVRGYNGMGCRWTNNGQEIYCGPDCNDYVKKVKKFAGLGDTEPTSGTEPASLTLSEITKHIICTNTASVSDLGNCQESKGVLLDTVTECDFLGGWPIYSVSDEDVTSGRKVCCRQEGCCVKGNGLTASGLTACTGQSTTPTTPTTPTAPTTPSTPIPPSQTQSTFEQHDCKDVTGCCVWQEDGCKKAPSTQQMCGGKTFYPLESNCESHPDCQLTTLGSDEKCHYCGSNMGMAKSLDPNAQCEGGCCLAPCPPNSVIVPDTIYYNQCSFGQQMYCHAACGPTSLKMGLAAAGYTDYPISYLWDKCGTTSSGTDSSIMSNFICSINACWSPPIVSNPSEQFIEEQLRTGNPMIIGVNIDEYASQWCTTGDGHYVLVVGYSPDYVILNDPSPYPSTPANGDHLILTKSLFYNNVLSYRNYVIPIVRRS